MTKKWVMPVVLISLALVGSLIFGLMVQNEINYLKYYYGGSVFLMVEAPPSINISIDHSAMWNKIQQNVSVIPQYWNGTVPSNLAGKSLANVVEALRAKNYSPLTNEPIFYVVVHPVDSDRFKNALTKMGFTVGPPPLFET